MMIPSVTTLAVIASKSSIHLNSFLLSYTPYPPVIAVDEVCVMKAGKIL